MNISQDIQDIQHLSLPRASHDLTDSLMPMVPHFLTKHSSFTFRVAQESPQNMPTEPSFVVQPVKLSTLRAINPHVVIFEVKISQFFFSLKTTHVFLPHILEMLCGLFVLFFASKRCLVTPTWTPSLRRRSIHSQGRFVHWAAAACNNDIPAHCQCGSA